MFQKVAAVDVPEKNADVLRFGRVAWERPECSRGALFLVQVGLTYGVANSPPGLIDHREVRGCEQRLFGYLAHAARDLGGRRVKGNEAGAKSAEMLGSLRVSVAPIYVNAESNK